MRGTRPWSNIRSLFWGVDAIELDEDLLSGRCHRRKRDRWAGQSRPGVKLILVVERRPNPVSRNLNRRQWLLRDEANRDRCAATAQGDSPKTRIDMHPPWTHTQVHT
jgi:hypothetical protein